ncbi:NAD(P)H-dependent flavin oxidoreductase [Psychrobacter sp. I-STPA6b]|uniref:NAD(P)H-dependent flavin oxidoreductase n=1 Tax=Psychrobacter sp. I-STPA6b TaxID=2585718 RepID=UPI001D0C8061|nr:nitronate monooxygenase [Psychrobacter sp. I-STPA6b]
MTATAHLPNSLMQTLNLTCPIVQAPMAGGATTPELISAVSNFGGLGSLGAGMTAPDTLWQQINSIKSLTNKPFAVNLMVLSESESSTFDSDMPSWLSDFYQQHNIEVNLPSEPAQSFAKQFAVLLDNPVPVASFTFGIISDEQVQALHQCGTKVVGTANHPLEAKAWADIGADAVCMQGVEAGGHRGGWLLQSQADPLGLLTLLSQTRTIVDIPLIASGGIMTGQDIKTVQTAGAELAQMGTAFLTTHESGINATYKQQLLNVATGKRSAQTRLTRLFSGKQARGLVNEYLTKFAKYEQFINNDKSDSKNTLPPYPQLNAMTKPMRAWAGQQQNPEYLSLWAGQGVAQVKAESVAELMERLMGEYRG